MKSPKYIILLHRINIRMLHSTFECCNICECRTFVYVRTNITSVLQSNSQLQAVKARDMALYAFLWQLKLHAFNYTSITYGYVGVQS